MSRISSIHIEAGKLSTLPHITREHPTVNSIFTQEHNQFNWDSSVAMNIYRRELRIRSKAYTDQTNQIMQRDVITHLSVVINLNEKHNIYDLEDIVEYLENTLDTVVFLRAVHKDEGYWDNGKPVINYHAHLEMMGIDSQGYSIRRKLTKNYLSDLQTKVASFLQMPRGKKNSKNQRIGAYEYKEAMRRVEIEKAEKSPVQDDLVEQNTQKTNLLRNLENYIQALAGIFNYHINDIENSEELGHLYELIYNSKNNVGSGGDTLLLDEDTSNDEDIVIKSILTP